MRVIYVLQRERERCRQRPMEPCHPDFFMMASAPLLVGGCDDENQRTTCLGRDRAIPNQRQLHMCDCDSLATCPDIHNVASRLMHPSNGNGARHGVHSRCIAEQDSVYLYFLGVLPTRPRFPRPLRSGDSAAAHAPYVRSQLVPPRGVWSGPEARFAVMRIRPLRGLRVSQRETLTDNHE